MQDSLSRRSFLKAGAATLASFPLLYSPAIKVYHIGLQLYSVRDDMQKDPVGTLEKIAKIGYKEVEHAQYINRRVYGFTAKEFKKVLDDTGLSMPTSHTLFKKEYWLKEQNDVSDEWKMALEDALTMGQSYIISPQFDWDFKNPDELKKGVEAFQRCGELTHEAGLRFGYHNHSAEFEIKYKGEPVYDYMINQWDRTHVFLQLDLANLSVGHADPMVWLRKHPLRFESMHVKDRQKSTPESTLLGQGVLNLDEIVTFANKNTFVKYWIIEQESYGSTSPLEAARLNLKYFKELISPKTAPFSG
jgi:sugar phosphate isomerase/epimerase